MSIVKTNDVKYEIDENLQIKEMLRLCVKDYFEKFGEPISKTSIYKILYRIDKSLPEHNALKNKIHFYWYMYGAFSEQINYSLTESLNDKTITKVDFKKSFPDNKYFNAFGKELFSHNKDFKEYKEKLKEILSDTPKTLDELKKQIYKLYAPYDFYNSFNITFKNNLKGYFNDISIKHTLKDLQYLLDTSIGGLPAHPSFNKFKYAYCDFADIVSDLLKLNLDHETEKLIKDKVEVIIRVFGKGVRILQHDISYEPQIKEWEKEFNDSINTIEKSVNELFNKYETLKTKNTEKRSLEIITLSELIDKSLRLRSNNNLKMINFISLENIPSTNNGCIDAEIFHKLDNEKLKSLLIKFKNTHNASIHYKENNKPKITNYRLITS